MPRPGQPARGHALPFTSDRDVRVEHRPPAHAAISGCRRACDAADISQPLASGRDIRARLSCSTLQHAATRCNTRHAATRGTTLQHAAPPCNRDDTSRCTARAGRPRLGVLQCTAACCSAAAAAAAAEAVRCSCSLRHGRAARRAAACCCVLQRVAACCDVLQRVAACCSVLHAPRPPPPSRPPSTGPPPSPCAASPPPARNTP
jgi:hypothetical protein